MTGQNLLTDLLKMADKNDNDTGYRELGLTWLKKIIKDIQNRQTSFHWRWLEKTATASTAEDQHSYDVPADLDSNKIMALYDRTNDITYKYVPYEHFIERVANPSNDSGDPRYWTYFATTFRLYPVPSSIIPIYMDYVKIMSDPMDDISTIDIPDKYEKVVTDGLMAYAYDFDPELGNGANQWALYENGVNKMMLDNNQMPAESVRPVSHRYRHLTRQDVDGKKSLLFPLSGDNI